MEARGAFELALAVFIRCRTARARKLKLKSAQSGKDTESLSSRQSCKQFLQIRTSLWFTLKSLVMGTYFMVLNISLLFIRALAVSLLLACWCGAALAAQTICGELKVALYEHGAMYYFDQQQKPKGIDLDIIDELERRSGCKFVRSVDSRIRIWTQMEQATLDMTVSAVANPERERYAQFLLYITGRNYALLQQDLPKSAYTLQGFLEQTDLKLGVIKTFRHGATFDHFVQQLRAQNRVIEVADYLSLYRIFKAKRVDAIIGLPVSWGQHDIRQTYLSEAQIMDWAPYERIEAGLALSRARIPPSTVQLLQVHLKAMLQDGTVLKIFRRHVSEPHASNLVLEAYR